ncbi:Non-specific serine/threonine protein kinase [Ascochyta lentis]
MRYPQPRSLTRKFGIKSQPSSRSITPRRVPPHCRHTQKPLAEGQTSEVYAARAELYWASSYLNGKGIKKGKTFKVAIKKLKFATPAALYLQEYKSLLKVAEPGHMNIVQTILAYISEENSGEEGRVQRFNFVFPLALGNLKELLRGSLKDSSLKLNVKDLWGEFEGLAGAIQYLHEHCRTAHRDIKPFNILLYDDESSSCLKAKITDFGIAINLNGVALHTPGTMEYLSAINYAAPELRKALQITEAGQMKIPSAQDLTTGDIWKLGAVFVELLTYLLSGCQGVEDFRDSITVKETNLTSDAFTRFDDGNRVKKEVLIWLMSLSRQSPRAAEMEPLLVGMLGEAGSRPSASEVVKEIRKMSFCSFWDGSNVLRFTEPDQVKAMYPVGFTDRIKEKIEQKLVSPVDWWPLKHGKRSCPSDHMRITWKWFGEELSVDVPRICAVEYRSHCEHVSCLPQPPAYPLPAYPGTTGSQSTGVPPSTPLNYTSASNQLTSTSNLGNMQSNAGSAQPISASNAYEVPHNQHRNHDTELYWCVNKTWANAKDMIMYPIKVNDILDDTHLFSRLNSIYTDIRGQFRRYLHWKSCEDIGFVEFATVYNDEPLVVKTQDGLPPLIPLVSSTTPPLPRYEYRLKSPPTTHMKMTHMKITAKQIIKGMKGRNGPSGSRRVLDAIPKHLFAASGAPLYQTQGTGWQEYKHAWGICAVQGWALKKILLSVSIISIVGYAIFAAWLVFVNKTDLQDSSVPYFMLTTTVCILFGILQFLDVA